MVESIEVDIDKLLSLFADRSRNLLEEAEEAYEGSKEHYDKCFRLCTHLEFARITFITNKIDMPKWYANHLERLRVMYAWHRDVGLGGKPKYILFTW